MSDQNQNRNEISLFFLLDLLIKNYKTILAISILSIILGFGYIYSRDRQYDIEIDVRLVGQNEIAKFKSITNSIISRVDATNLRTDIIGLDFINEKKLLNLFYDEFSNYKLINLVYFENLISKKGLSREDASNLSYDISANIQFITPRSEDGVYKIAFTAVNDVEFNISALKETINRINTEIYNGLKYEFENILTAINHDHNTAINNINGKLEARENILAQKKENEIYRLKEQYKIAENIELETNLVLDNPKLTQSIIDKSNDTDLSSMSSIELVFSERNAYLKGTKALEQEIENLTRREISDFLLLDSEYFSLKTLLNEKIISIIKDKNYFLSLMPKLKEFKSVDINYELARVSSNTSNKLTMFIFVAIGLFTSFVYILFTNLYRTYKKSLND